MWIMYTLTTECYVLKDLHYIQKKKNYQEDCQVALLNHFVNVNYDCEEELVLHVTTSCCLLK